MKIRRLLSEHRLLAQRLDELETRLSRHDSQIVAVVQAIQTLLAPVRVPRRRRIGFQVSVQR